MGKLIATFISIFITNATLALSAYNSTSEGSNVTIIDNTHSQNSYRNGYRHETQPNFDRGTITLEYEYELLNHLKDKSYKFTRNQLQMLSKNSQFYPTEVKQALTKRLLEEDVNFSMDNSNQVGNGESEKYARNYQVGNGDTSHNEDVSTGSTSSQYSRNSRSNSHETPQVNIRSAVEKIQNIASSNHESNPQYENNNLGQLGRNTQNINVGGTGYKYDSDMANFYDRETEFLSAMPNEEMGFSKKWQEMNRETQENIRKSREQGTHYMTEGEMFGTFTKKNIDPKSMNLEHFQNMMNNPVRGPWRLVDNKATSWQFGTMRVQPSKDGYWAYYKGNMEVGVNSRGPDGRSYLMITGKDFSEKMGIPIGYYVNEFGGIYNQQGTLAGVTRYGNTKMFMKIKPEPKKQEFETAQYY